jgi:2-polyprenyl-3-methyl-5-hydroxy-6-metoxy-1,4-benzoquinol methylase
MNTKDFTKGEIDYAFRLRAEFILENVVEKAKKNKPLNILDAGCGQGYYLKVIDQLISGHKITGIEYNKDKIQYLHTLEFDNHKVDITKGDIQKLHFEKNTFDIVICSEVLEHVPDDIKAIKEIKRVLKENGKAFITVPAKKYPLMWDPINLTLEKVLGQHIPKDIHWLAGIWADHLRLYTKEELKEKIDKVGFTSQKIKTIVSKAFPFSHLLFYGIGKNLVNFGIVGDDFDRFTPKKDKSKIHQFIQSFFDKYYFMNKGQQNTDNYLHVLAEVGK